MGRTVIIEFDSVEDAICTATIRAGWRSPGRTGSRRLPPTYRARMGSVLVVHVGSAFCHTAPVSRVIIMTNLDEGTDKLVTGPIPLLEVRRNLWLKLSFDSA
jgi:hypothetical protein